MASLSFAALFKDVPKGRKCDGQLRQKRKLTTPDPLFGSSNDILDTETPREEP